MIALASKFAAPQKQQSSTRTFGELLPIITGHLKRAFRDFTPERREDAIQEGLTNCFVAYTRLVQNGRGEYAFPAALARYAIKHYYGGRRVGMKLNGKDVLSEFCQHRTGVTVERLDRFDAADDCWREAVVNDPHTPVFTQVWFRIDFPAWLESLPRRTKKIAMALALGNTTSEVAKRFKISPARISQIRRELSASWHYFHSDKRELVAKAA